MAYRELCDLPKGAWDSHVHVIDDRFPMSLSRPYTPKQATLDELLAFHHSIGISHACIVSVSVYGPSNPSITSALSDPKLKSRGRAVVAIPTTFPDAELDAMHALGVRGIRYNLAVTKARIDKAAFEADLKAYAAKLKRLDWVIQLFVTLDQVALIADVVPGLDVDVVIDHLGAPDWQKDPREQNGYHELLELLRKKHVYVKLSGIYRFEGEKMPGLDEYIREIIKAGRSQVVFGSDWPHVGGAEMNKTEEDRLLPQDFRKVDIPAFIQKCKEWCGFDEETIRMIFVDNPRRLWKYNEDD